MSAPRQLRVNDAVIITYQGKNPSKYIVKQISVEGVYVYPEGKPSLLLNNPTISSTSSTPVQIHGTQEVFEARIEQPPPIEPQQAPPIEPQQAPIVSLTGVRDVDIKIIESLDDKNLLNACQTNRSFALICKDPIFWKQRLENRFPDIAAIRSMYPYLENKEFYLTTSRVYEVISESSNVRQTFIQETDDEQLIIHLIRLFDAVKASRRGVGSIVDDYVSIWVDSFRNSHINVLAYISRYWETQYPQHIEDFKDAFVELTFDWFDLPRDAKTVYKMMDFVYDVSVVAGEFLDLSVFVSSAIFNMNINFVNWLKRRELTIGSFISSEWFRTFNMTSDIIGDDTLDRVGIIRYLHENKDVINLWDPDDPSVTTDDIFRKALRNSREMKAMDIVSLLESFGY